MITIKNPDFYKTLNTVLLSFISIFGVFSLILLINVNEKLNTVIKDQAVNTEKIHRLERDFAEIKK